MRVIHVAWYGTWHWLYHSWFHGWHFLFQQIQLTNWAGNIVAGVIGFIVLSIFWPRLRKVVFGAVHRVVIAPLHAKLDAQHEALVKQAELHHRAALRLAREHHAEKMAQAQEHHEKLLASVNKVSRAPATRPTARKTS
jgi:hypothetical protein